MRKKSLYIALAVFLTGVSAGALQAQDFPPQGERPDPAAMYSKIDSNNDGCISLSEFESNKPSGPGGKGGRPPEGGNGKMGNLGDMFEKLDKNGDGVLSKEEFSSGKPPR